MADNKRSAKGITSKCKGVYSSALKPFWLVAPFCVHEIVLCCVNASRNGLLTFSFLKKIALLLNLIVNVNYSKGMPSLVLLRNYSCLLLLMVSMTLARVDLSLFWQAFGCLYDYAGHVSE